MCQSFRDNCMSDPTVCMSDPTVCHPDNDCRQCRQIELGTKMSEFFTRKKKFISLNPFLMIGTYLVRFYYIFVLWSGQFLSWLNFDFTEIF